MEPLIGEIRLFASRFTPEGWASCDGRLLLRQQYPGLFAVINTQYGGDGEPYFALPDLQGRTAQSDVRAGVTFPGTRSGTSSYRLQERQLPSHNHQVSTYSVSGNQYLSEAPTGFAYIGRYAVKGTTSVAESFVDKRILATATLNRSTVALEGNSKPHDNMQPFLTLNYCIALTGIYPGRP